MPTLYSESVKDYTIVTGTAIDGQVDFHPPFTAILVDLFYTLPDSKGNVAYG